MVVTVTGVKATEVSHRTARGAGAARGRRHPRHQSGDHRQSHRQRAGTAALINANQIGTVTETLAAMTACRKAGWAQMMSHRSGETEGTFIADLASGSSCGQLKSVTPARREPVAKHNRLIEIEAAEPAPYGLGATT